jgi:membrane-associated HD superfamily phosphohydrolase
VIAGYEQVNKSASQQSESDLLTSGQVSKSASQQAENIASQQTDKLTSQNELAETDNTSDNSATEEVSKPTSQQSDNLANQEVNKLEVTSNQQPENSTSQRADNIESQQVSKPIIRKATFQVDAAILADLDRYHLQLQMQMGRRNAPYKEILVEEAIAQWLERAAKSPDRAVKSLLKRQEQR